MQYGEEVFGDRENFHDWLMNENIAVGGMVPADLLDTSVGLGMVKDELGRMEHGILAWSYSEFPKVNIKPIYQVSEQSFTAEDGTTKELN